MLIQKQKILMKNSFRGLLAILLFLFLNNSAQGGVTSTYSINSTTIQKIDKLIDKDTIVFVELDDVLVMPQSKMFYYGDNPHRLFINTLIALAMENSIYLNRIATWYQMRKVRLVEDCWQNFINNLKKRNIPVYGLCNMPIQLQNIEQKRFLELKELGVEFTDKINNTNIMEIAKKEDWSSQFYYGIIFTGPFNKAQTLIDFIKVTNISPKKIVVFNKNKNDLEMIQRLFYRFRIDFYSILYLGAKQFTQMPDSNVVKLQQKMLFEDNKWLEDDEAESLLKSLSERNGQTKEHLK